MFCITSITARTASHLVRVEHTQQNVIKGIYKDVNLDFMKIIICTLSTI